MSAESIQKHVDLYRATPRGRKVIGRWFAAERKRRELSQNAWALSDGVTQVRVSRMEAGRALAASLPVGAMAFAAGFNETALKRLLEALPESARQPQIGRPRGPKPGGTIGRAARKSLTTEEQVIAAITGGVLDALLAGSFRASAIKHLAVNVSSTPTGLAADVRVELVRGYARQRA